MSKTTIEYKGVVTTVEAGKSAVIRCEGDKMEDEVVVTAGSGGGGDNTPWDGDFTKTGEPTSGGSAPDINGIIREYKVNAGASVSAGDFVEFVNKWNSNGIFGEVSTEAVAACKLGNNTVFVAYKQGSALMGVVCVIDGNTITVGAETTLASAISSTIISALAVTDSNVFITYQSLTGSKTYVQCVICTIEGTTITTGELTSFIGANAYSVVLTDSKLLLVYASSGVKCKVCTIEGTTITLGTETTITSSNNSTFSATALTDSKVFVAYSSINYLYCNVCTIDGTTITVGTEKQVKYAPNATFHHSAIALTDSKVFMVYTSSTTVGIVYTIEGTTITAGTETTITSFTGLYVSAVALTNSKVFIAYRHYVSATSSLLEGVICTIEGTTITAGTPKAFEEVGRVSVTGVSAVAFSDSSVFVVSSGSLGIYAGATIEGTSITLDIESEEGIGTYIQPATSNLHNVGIAKTSGSEGETVAVYCAV
jgi:hypothetical protein